MIFSSVVSWPFYLYRTHLYSLYCYSRTFLTSYKILIQAKGLLVAPASLPTPQHPAQASSRCSLRTEDVRGSAHLLSVQIVRLNSLHCTISYVHAVGPAVPSAWNVFQSLFFWENWVVLLHNYIFSKKPLHSLALHERFPSAPDPQC